MYQTITNESRKRELAGHTPTHIADDLAPIITAIVDDLDHRLSPERPRWRRE